MRKVLQKIPVFAWVLSLAATLMTGVWFGLPTIARNVKVDYTFSASGETAHCLRTKVVWLTVLQKKGARQNLAPDDVVSCEWSVIPMGYTLYPMSDEPESCDSETKWKAQGMSLGFHYLTSHPFPFTAAYTFSMTAFTSASVSVFSNDWNTRRNASEVLSPFLNSSNFSLRSKSCPACARMTKSTASGSVPAGLQSAISRTMNG